MGRDEKKNASIQQEARIILLRMRRGGKHFEGGSAKGNT
jgi:hypothetical protein